MRPELVRKKPLGRRSFSKGPPHCPAMRPKFSRSLSGVPNDEKPLDFSGFSRSSVLWPERSEPLAATLGRAVVLIKAVAVETTVMRAVVTVKTAVHHAMAEALTGVHPGEDAKPALLSLIEGLVEGIGG